MTKAESAIAHEKAEVVILRWERKSDTFRPAVELDTH